MNSTANIYINLSKKTGTLKHNWNYIGMDECNYIHTPEGEKILKEFGRFSEKKYYVRPHFLLCNGNLQSTYKWGSTNIYTEDKNGSPIYNFTAIDRIFDTILNAGCKPFVELGFMPLDLVDEAYIDEEDLKEGSWTRYSNYKRKYHTCPPKDYVKWQNLITALVNHLVEKYGGKEVESWYFELWNEPDILYWSGSHDEFIKLYDYTVAGVEAAFPNAYIGGPAVTGPLEGSMAEPLLDSFLEHCRSGKNHVTGKTGTRLDFITFHVKGGGFLYDADAEKKSPCVTTMLSQLRTGLNVIKKHGYEGLEVVLSEADPDGWAAGGIYDNANMNFRNTSYYTSFVAASFHHMELLARSMGFDVRPLSWAFVFRGERCFEGTRAFQTQGIDKPIFHYFRMLSMMGNDEAEFLSDKAQKRESTENPWSDDLPAEVNGFATSDRDGAQIFIYCHHDNQWRSDKGYNVNINLSGLKSENASADIYLVDENNCNAHTMWKDIGSPDYPEGSESAKLIEAGRFRAKSMNEELETDDHSANIEVHLPVHSVCLINIRYKQS